MLIGVQTLTRTRRIHSGMADEMILMAVEQFLPSVGAGALISIVLMRLVPANIWMLPGLWQITYSLGVFASCRFLPAADGGCGGLVPGNRADMHRPWGCASTFAMDDGPCLWHRATDRGRSLLWGSKDDRDEI